MNARANRSVDACAQVPWRQRLALVNCSWAAHGGPNFSIGGAMRHYLNTVSSWFMLAIATLSADAGWWVL